MVKGKIEVYT